jgi:hypothetical protein
MRKVRKSVTRYTNGDIGKTGPVLKNFLPPPDKLVLHKRVSKMRRPHPGLSVRRDCLEPLGLNVTEGAKALCVTRQALNNLVNGKSGISPESS